MWALFASLEAAIQHRLHIVGTVPVIEACIKEREVGFNNKETKSTTHEKPKSYAHTLYRFTSTSNGTFILINNHISPQTSIYAAFHFSDDIPIETLSYVGRSGGSSLWTRLSIPACNHSLNHGSKNGRNLYQDYEYSNNWRNPISIPKRIFLIPLRVLLLLPKLSRIYILTLAASFLQRKKDIRQNIERILLLFSIKR